MEHNSIFLFDPALSFGNWPYCEFAHLVVQAWSQDDAFFLHTVQSVCLVYQIFYLSLKLHYWLFHLEVAWGSCYFRRCIVLLVGTLVPGGLPMLYCCIFGGLVYLEMYLFLLGVVPFASAQSLALRHLQVYSTLSRFPTSILKCVQWIISLTYLCVVNSMEFIFVLIS